MNLYSSVSSYLLNVDIRIPLLARRLIVDLCFLCSLYTVFLAQDFMHNATNEFVF